MLSGRLLHIAHNSSVVTWLPIQSQSSFRSYLIPKSRPFAIEGPKIERFLTNSCLNLHFTSSLVISSFFTLLTSFHFAQRVNIWSSNFPIAQDMWYKENVEMESIDYFSGHCSTLSMYAPALDFSSISDSTPLSYR